MNQLKTCPQGHKFYKSSDCPVCPVCEAKKMPSEGFLSKLSAPARRALENKGITTLDQLSSFSEKDLMRLHGFGKSSILILKDFLKQEHLHL